MIALLGLGLTALAESKPDPDVGVSFGVFYSSLAPYGEWVDGSFGHAWRPLHVGYGWRPYVYGRWMWTDYGWYWVSSEPFGWATFHYGRWEYDDYYGWIWIPDYTWGPAWVEWRYNDDYIGWAPLTPYATFTVDIGITYADRWAAPVHYWNFVPCRYFVSTHIVDYVQPVERTRRFFGRTRGVVDIRERDNRIVNRGVDVAFVERRVNTRINRVDVVTTDRAGSDRVVRDTRAERVEVYRPRIEGSTRGEQVRPTPPAVRGGQRGTPVQPPSRDAGRQGGVRQTPAQPQRNAPTILPPRGDAGRQTPASPNVNRRAPAPRPNARDYFQEQQMKQEQQRRDAFENRPEMQRQRQQQREIRPQPAPRVERPKPQIREQSRPTPQRPENREPRKGKPGRG